MRNPSFDVKPKKIFINRFGTEKKTKILKKNDFLKNQKSVKNLNPKVKNCVKFVFENTVILHFCASEPALVCSDKVPKKTLRCEMFL